MQLGCDPPPLFFLGGKQLPRELAQFHLVRFQLDLLAVQLSFSIVLLGNVLKGHSYSRFFAFAALNLDDLQKSRKAAVVGAFHLIFTGLDLLPLDDPPCE